MRHTFTIIAGAALLAAGSRGQTPIVQIGAHTNLVFTLAPHAQLVYPGRSNQIAFELAWSATEEASGFIHVAWVQEPAHAAYPTFSMLLTAAGEVHLVPPGNGLSPGMLEALENTTGNAQAYTAQIRMTPATAGTRFIGAVEAFWPFPISAEEMTGHAEIVLAGNGLVLNRLDAKIFPAPTLFLVR